ncbi:MAG TPA: 2-C-methyl-D-erythritol 4-phosphate cytidylyltransferase, partial [Thermomicrobiales bacterium]|nr:2-C-methyl-D-erythritol 4-phosphate cytidylyltransferase [Thermomicrobiales bacterium]
QQRLRAEPDLLPTAIEELLRAYAPVTMAREAAVDTELGGCPVRAGRPLLLWSVERLARHRTIEQVVVVLGVHTHDRGRMLLDSAGLTGVVTCAGGTTRADSARSGLARLPDAGIILVHDAARPLLDAALIDRVIAAARQTGAAIPVIPVSDTLHRRADRDVSGGVVDRDSLAAAQTPQAARRDWLANALSHTDQSTDEGGMLQQAGYPVALVAGETRNLKITWPIDLIIARAIMAAGEEAE